MIPQSLISIKLAEKILFIGKVFINNFDLKYFNNEI